MSFALFTFKLALFLSMCLGAFVAVKRVRSEVKHWNDATFKMLGIQITVISAALCLSALSAIIASVF